jgi:hypothetical protein
MSLRGVGKAIYRTPHQLFGQKSADDVVFKQWEHNVKTAIAGIEYLKAEDAKLAKFWENMVTNFAMVIEIFRDVHSQLEANRSKRDSRKDSARNTMPDKNEEFTDITLHEIKEAAKLARMLQERTIIMATRTSESFKVKCNEMIKQLKRVEKLLTKRDHKKIDYDMQVKKMETVLKVETSTDKDRTKLEHTQKKLTDAEVVYKDFNDKIKLIVPAALSDLSEFLSKLTLKLYFSNADTIRFIQRNLEKFSRIHGVVSDTNVLSYESIIAEFETTYRQGQSKLADLDLLKDFSAMRQKTVGEKTVKHVNNAAGTVVDTTVNFTSTLYTKATKPNQRLSVSLGSFKIDNPIKPYSKNGMFTNALDPVEFVRDTDLSNQLSEADWQSLYPNGLENDGESTGDDESTKYDHGDDNDGSQIHNSSFTSTEPVSRTSTSTTTDYEWMKPLKNSTLNKVRSPTQSSKTFPIAEDENEVQSISTSLNATTISDDRYPANSRVSSVNLSAKTETYKYVNVTMSSISKHIYVAVSSPEITKSPITTPKAKISVPDKDISTYVAARSSITANAFAALNQI